MEKKVSRKEYFLLEAKIHSLPYLFQCEGVYSVIYRRSFKPADHIFMLFPNCIDGEEEIRQKLRRDSR